MWTHNPWKSTWRGADWHSTGHNQKADLCEGDAWGTRWSYQIGFLIPAPSPPNTVKLQVLEKKQKQSQTKSFQNRSFRSRKMGAKVKRVAFAFLFWNPALFTRHTYANSVFMFSITGKMEHSGICRFAGEYRWCRRQITEICPTCPSHSFWTYICFLSLCRLKYKRRLYRCTSQCTAGGNHNW